MSHGTRWRLRRLGVEPRNRRETRIYLERVKAPLYVQLSGMASDTLPSLN